MKRFSIHGTIHGIALDLRTDSRTMANLVAQTLTNQYNAPFSVWAGSECLDVTEPPESPTEAFVHANDAYLPYPRNN